MIICSARVYEFKGVRFEYRRWAYGWWPLKKDGEPYKIITSKVRPVWVEWSLLPQSEKEKYII